MPRRSADRPNGVAPYAGAWIETSVTCSKTSGATGPSPPTRGRGLKLLPMFSTATANAKQVAPYAGAWIETCRLNEGNRLNSAHSRPLRGGVD